MLPWHWAWSRHRHRVMGDLLQNRSPNGRSTNFLLLRSGGSTSMRRTLCWPAFPAANSYLLLQRELASSGTPAKRTLRKSLVPLRLPSQLSSAAVNDNLLVRLRRGQAQLRLICFRLRFHLTEGVRYMWESWRWHQLALREQQENDNSLTNA